jgi:hypothetical protein
MMNHDEGQVQEDQDGNGKERKYEEQSGGVKDSDKGRG